MHSSPIEIASFVLSLWGDASQGNTSDDHQSIIANVSSSFLRIKQAIDANCTHWSNCREADELVALAATKYRNRWDLGDSITLTSSSITATSPTTPHSFVSYLIRDWDTLLAIVPIDCLLNDIADGGLGKLAIICLCEPALDKEAVFFQSISSSTSATASRISTVNLSWRFHDIWILEHKAASEHAEKLHSSVQSAIQDFADYEASLENREVGGSSGAVPKLDPEEEEFWKRHVSSTNSLNHDQQKQQPEVLSSTCTNDKSESDYWDMY